MRLITYEIETQFGLNIRIGVLENECVIDLNQAYKALFSGEQDSVFTNNMANLLFPTDMICFFRSGEIGLQTAREIIKKIKETKLCKIQAGQRFIYNASDVRILAPVLRPNTIRDFSTFEQHQIKVTLQKSGAVVPDVWYEMPVYWKANPDNTIGPGADILWPGYTERLDYELEFGIYIAKMGKNISVEKAHEYIAGYTIFNDVSARDHQEKEMVMTYGPAKGKDFDNSKVFGPCIVTPDEFEDKSHAMIARINGEEWSRSSTDQMYWTFAQMIAYASQSETLMPGDFLASGTCPTGTGIEINRWIQPGDVIELEVEGIGILKNKVIRQ